ncbi:MAG: YraN family protein [Ruminococcaceae bacterium]|nr:YraN family protein [Oscillospiraceae bacterium]
MSIFSKQDIGRLGEKLAARYLKKQGYRVLARNLHFGKNELDLVVKNKEYLAFVEVKTRTFETAEEAEIHRPALAVNREKRERTLQATRDYLQKHPAHGLCPRLDVIEVALDRHHPKKVFRIHHIEAAFTATGKVR